MAARIEMFLREGEVPPDGLAPAVSAALETLTRSGATENELEASMIAADGAASLPMLYLALHVLGQRGALSYRVSGDSGTLAIATCKAPVDLRPVDSKKPLLLSRFALLRRDGDGMIIETPLAAAKIAIADPRVLPLLAMLTTPKLLEELTAILPPDEVPALCSLLAACGIFAGDGENAGALAYWSFHELIFHSRSRGGRHPGAFGTTFPFRGRTEPPPVVKPSMSDDVVALERPELQGEFTSVIEHRHSSREFGETPLTRRELSEFLFRAARVREIYEAGTGQQLSRRPYPGGGAVYELEIYATVRDCIDLPPGLYHYCPLEHQLARIGDLSEALVNQATQVPYGPPQVLLTITARFGRVFWKYESMGYALILKDVGALMQTFYLVAEAMGLGACALGGGDSDAFAAASGIDYYDESSVGEFIVGSRRENRR